MNCLDKEAVSLQHEGALSLESLSHLETELANAGSVSIVVFPSSKLKVVFCLQSLQHK